MVEKCQHENTNSVFVRYHRKLSFQNKSLYYFCINRVLFGIFGYEIFNSLREGGNTCLTGLYGVAFLKLAGVDGKKGCT